MIMISKFDNDGYNEVDINNNNGRNHMIMMFIQNNHHHLLELYMSFHIQDIHITEEHAVT
jgi:hypothetical protein